MHSENIHVLILDSKNSTCSHPFLPNLCIRLWASSSTLGRYLLLRCRSCQLKDQIGEFRQLLLDLRQLSTLKTPAPYSSKDYLVNKRLYQLPDLQICDLPVDILQSLSATQKFSTITLLSYSPPCPATQPRQGPSAGWKTILASRSPGPIWMKIPCWNTCHDDCQKFRPQRPKNQRGNRSQRTKYSSNNDKLRNHHLDV